MFPRLFQIGIAFGVFSGSWERNLSERELRKIDEVVRSVDDTVFDSNDYQEDHLRSPRDQNDDIIGLESLSSYVNRLANDNKQDQTDDDDFDRFLRNQNEELCRKTGRCGCRPGVGRCGDSVSDQRTVNDIRNLLDNLERNLNRENWSGESSIDSEGGENALNDRKQDENDLADLLKDLHKNEDNDGNNNNSRDDKAFNDNNHVDVVVVNDLADIADVLRQSGLVNTVDLDDLKSDNLDDIARNDAGLRKPRVNTKAIILDLGKFYNDSLLANRDDESHLERSIVHKEEQMNPEQFLEQFNVLKEKVTNALVDYVTSRKTKKLNLPLMNHAQKRKIKILKGKMRHNKQRKSKSEVKSDVSNIVFGRNSKVKVIPSETDSSNIVIPDWMYRMLSTTKTNALRSPKRVLPLTSKQINKLILQNGGSSPRPLISKIWRRNFASNLKTYGLPFKLAVEGLGQFNN